MHVSNVSENTLPEICFTENLLSNKPELLTSYATILHNTMKTDTASIVDFLFVIINIYTYNNFYDNHVSSLYLS